MQESLAQTTLRIPQDVRAWVIKQAKNNRRSFNSEIIHQLEMNKLKESEMREKEEPEHC